MPDKTTRKNSKQLTQSLFDRMAQCPDAETLNDQVLTPFVTALEKIAAARGYVFNIQGARSNLVITNDDDAEVIYQLVEDYLDNAGLDSSE